MADKNLHDIKIDDLDNSKKTPLKNILTLLALLFIILVISVAITRLILDTDEDGLNESNSTETASLLETTDNDEKDSSMATTAGAVVAGGVAGAMLANRANLTERNVSTNSSSDSKDSDKNNASSTKDAGSKIKATLREHTPVKKEVTTHPAPKKHIVLHHTEPKKHVVKKEPTHSTDKRYVDKVVSSSKKASTTHNVSHLGEKRAGYYIKVGTFKDTSTSVNKIKKTGLDYILIKPKNDKTTTRVLIGPFKSNWGAKQHLPRVKSNIAEGAYITRID